MTIFTKTSMIKLPEGIRVGNIVEYYGPRGRYIYLHVLNVENSDDGDRIFTLRNPYEADKSFTAKSDELIPVYLNEIHLQRLGFDFTQATRRYFKDGITIKPFGYPAGGSDDLTFMNLGFRILPPGFPNDATLAQIQESTIGPLYLHILQNYCADNHIDTLDFGQFK